MNLKLIISGAILVVIGAALPFAMLLGVIKSTLLLNFVAAISSITGIIIGFIGIIDYYQNKHRDNS
jgi:hypothetical protein